MQKRSAIGLNSILLINTKAASQHFKTGGFPPVSHEAQQHISRSLTGVPRFSGHISGLPRSVPRFSGHISGLPSVPRVSGHSTGNPQCHKIFDINRTTTFSKQSSDDIKNLKYNSSR